MVFFLFFAKKRCFRGIIEFHSCAGDTGRQYLALIFSCRRFCVRVCVRAREGGFDGIWFSKRDNELYIYVCEYVNKTPILIMHAPELPKQTCLSALIALFVKLNRIRCECDSGGIRIHQL